MHVASDHSDLFKVVSAWVAVVSSVGSLVGLFGGGEGDDGMHDLPQWVTVTLRLKSGIIVDVQTSSRLRPRAPGHPASEYECQRASE